MKINEIFYSIQGESTYAGLPCAFLRLTGCNIRCSYCDTRYAYEEGIDLNIDHIIEKVAEFRCSLVTVTGGEPLMSEETKDLLKALIGKQYTVLLETNGTLPLQGIPDGIIIIMDVKCPSSGFSDKTCWKNLSILSPKDEIKFVIGDETDYRWSVDIVKRNQLAQKHSVLFSPASPRLKANLLAEWILRDRLPVRLQLQWHKVIWGEGKRGV